MTRPRVLVLADVPGWAWARKAAAYQTHLADEFDVTVAYHATAPRFDAFDLVHLFEVSQINHLTAYGSHTLRPFKAVAGLTANVWRTWGRERMHAWAKQVDALHGNSRFIVDDLKEFHARVFYTPNGVDPVVYQRRAPRPSGPVIFGHVGKPNLRKGADVIVVAAREADVELRLIQRTVKLALSEAEMVDWYQGIDVMVCASNMDGTPNPLLEGAACECALLSTAIGNMPEFIVNGRNGCLLLAELPYVAPGDPVDPRGVAARRQELAEELARTMRWLADDPVRTRSMGMQAKQTVLDGWTWACQVRHVAAMWAAVLSA